MVAQWLTLLPHRKKAVGLNPGSDLAFSVWSLHVRVPAWVPRFPLPSKICILGTELELVARCLLLLTFTFDL